MTDTENLYAGKRSRQKRSAFLPRFLRIPQKHTLKIYPPRYDSIFAARQAVLFAMRTAIAFVAGGSECVVCGSVCGAVPVCKKCVPLYDVPFAEAAPHLANDLRLANESHTANVPHLANESRCSVCGKLLLSEQNICMRCRGEKELFSTDKVLPLFSYRLWNKKLLFDWKIVGIRSLSPFFAERLRFTLFQLNQKIIVPVPPRPGKIKERGWDQIEELSVFLKHSGFAVCRVLERLSKTEQKKLGREGRLLTVGAAYSIKPEKKLKRALKLFDGKMPEEVCLVDDVMTTGATLEACAKVLKAAGAKKVNAVTLFCVD